MPVRGSVAVALLVAVQGFGSGPAVADERVPFQPAPQGLLVVEARLDGDGPFRLLLDTGANGTAISDAVAERLGATVIAHTLEVSPGGRARRAVVRLSELEVGGRHVANLPVSVIPANVLREAEVDGVLGQDVLARFDYTLDLRGSYLRWDDTASLTDGDAIRFPLADQEGRFVVALAQGKAGSRTLRLVPDSGATHLVLFERGGPVPLTWRELGSVALAGWSGERTVRRVVVPRLRVGRDTFRELRAAVVARPEADAPDVDGLLPLQLFASVSLRANDGYMVLRRR